MEEVCHGDEFADGDSDDDLPIGSKSQHFTDADGELARLTETRLGAARVGRDDLGIAVWSPSVVFGSASHYQQRWDADEPEADADVEQDGSPSECFDGPYEQWQRNRSRGGEGHECGESSRSVTDEPVDDGCDEDDEFTEGESDAEHEHYGIEVPELLHLAHEDESASGDKHTEG